MAESEPLCVEQDCDRHALDGDARCALHSARLGPLARERAIPVVASEIVLDAPRDREVDPRRFRSASRLIVASLGIEGISVGLLFVLGATQSDWTDVMSSLAVLAFLTSVTSPLAAVHCIRQASTARQKAFAWITALVAFGSYLALVGLLALVLVL